MMTAAAPRFASRQPACVTLDLMIGVPVRCLRQDLTTNLCEFVTLFDE